MFQQPPRTPSSDVAGSAVQRRLSEAKNYLHKKVIRFFNYIYYSDSPAIMVAASAGSGSRADTAMMPVLALVQGTQHLQHEPWRNCHD